MRPIDADALLKKLPREELVSRIIVAGMPTIESEPVRRGHWEVIDEVEPRSYGCSNCKAIYYWQDNYCPHCGARMEEQE